MLTPKMFFDIYRRNWPDFQDKFAYKYRAGVRRVMQLNAEWFPGTFLSTLEPVYGVSWESPMYHYTCAAIIIKLPKSPSAAQFLLERIVAEVISNGTINVNQAAMVWGSDATGDEMILSGGSMACWDPNYRQERHNLPGEYHPAYKKVLNWMEAYKAALSLSPIYLLIETYPPMETATVVISKNRP